MEMKKEIEIGGKTISFDTETFAQQATASVMVRSGETMVLTTLVFGKELENRQDFLPLTVEYREHISAAGKFPGGFFKREGRPTEKEVLTCRLIDRTIRPLFPKTLNREIQVCSFVFSFNPEVEPDMLAVLGASAAVTLGPIKAKDVVAGVRVGLVDGQLVVNPSVTDLQKSELSLVVMAGTESLLMLEGSARNLPEDRVLEAVGFGEQEARKIVQFFKDEFMPEKSALPEPEKQPWEDTVISILDSRFGEVTRYAQKVERAAFFEGIRQEVLAAVGPEVAPKEVQGVFERELRTRVRRQILTSRVRMDGRQATQLRPISCQVGILPRVHGSALFRRGETQALALITLGTWADEQRIEGLLEETRKRFTLHYNFPPFSVGETRPMRGPGRREIGHGAMAERALNYSLPDEAEFPYTIRIVSDILESHGSSSMASVCAGSLGMMDAGVPVKEAMGGVALGMIKEGEDYLILTDIAGEEDHYGDMDLKIAGTRNGITSIQMDVKTTQLSYEMLRQAFLQSRDARGQILDVMTATLPTHRPQLSPYAPRIETLKIPVDKIGAVIGPGGKNIRRITEDTGAQIEIDDDGSVQIISKDDASREKAILIIRGMTEEPQVGQIYRNVKVSRILSFGAMVEYLPGQEGLVHVSELDHRYVSKVEDIAKVGDTMDVKIVGIDDQHRVNLSRKALMEVPPGLDKENSSAQQARGPRRERSDFSGRQSGRPQPKLTHRAFRSGPGKDKQR